MFRVKITGLDLTRAQLALLKEDIGSLKPAWRKISLLAASRVRARTPVRSGKLKASVEADYDRQYATASAGNSISVPYAPVVNYTYGKHFMQEASIEVAPLVKPILEAEIHDVIRKRGFS